VLIRILLTSLLFLKTFDKAKSSAQLTPFSLFPLRLVSVTAGILIASAANLGLAQWDEGWRLSYGGNIVFALLLLACLVFMPESPRWLAAHAASEDDDEKLARVLTKLHYEDEIEAETKKLVAEVKEEKELGDASWSEVFAKDNHLVLGMSFQAFQQVRMVSVVATSDF
jgi:Sugar (and other) transporter